MNRAAIIQALDDEIARLEKVKRILTGGNVLQFPKAKRHLSAAARKRISDAQHRRWAKQKRAA